MSLLGKVFIFAIKGASRPLLANVGRHIGNACGNVLGRKIDEKHGTYQDDEDIEGVESEEGEEEDDDEDDEEGVK